MTEVEPPPSRRSRSTRLEIVYRVGVILKGVDGLVELGAGLLLGFAPSVLDELLDSLAVFGGGHHPLRNFVAYWAAHLDQEFVAGTHVFVIAFLIVHGVIKIVLVYCLLREYRWVYPYAITVLALLTAGQVVVLARHPTPGVAVLTVLDVIIIWLVWREWRMLRARARASADVVP